MPFSLLDYSLQFVNNKCCEHSRWQKGLLLPSVEHFGLPRKKIFAVSKGLAFVRKKVNIRVGCYVIFLAFFSDNNDLKICTEITNVA